MNRIKFQVYRDAVLQYGYMVWIGTAGYGTESKSGYPTHDIAPGSYAYMLKLETVIAKNGVVEIPIVPEGELHTIRFDIVESPSPPHPPPPVIYPPASGEEIQGTVGTRCDIMGKGAFGQNWYSYRDRYTNRYGSWGRDYSEAANTANRDTRCFEPIPQAPETDTVTSAELTTGLNHVREETKASIQTAISWIQNGFSDSLDGIVEYLEESITDLGASLKRAISDLETGLEGKISKISLSLKSITDLEIPSIWDMIGNIYDASVIEAAAWRKGVQDLDAGLKAWIVTSILDIIWAAITRDSKED